jgi:hypothetical protein
VKTPKFTDKQRGGRYRTAAESSQPGYLARRMKAYARLAGMRAARDESNVTPMQKRKKA